MLTSAHWSVGQLNTVALEVLILVCLVPECLDSEIKVVTIHRCFPLFNSWANFNTRWGLVRDLSFGRRDSSEQSKTKAVVVDVPS